MHYLLFALGGEIQFYSSTVNNTYWANRRFGAFAPGEILAPATLGPIDFIDSYSNAGIQRFPLTPLRCGVLLRAAAPPMNVDKLCSNLSDVVQ
jgi:hypothetical protein